MIGCDYCDEWFHAVCFNINLVSKMALFWRAKSLTSTTFLLCAPIARLSTHLTTKARSATLKLRLSLSSPKNLTKSQSARMRTEATRCLVKTLLLMFNSQISSTKAQAHWIVCLQLSSLKAKRMTLLPLRACGPRSRRLSTIRPTRVTLTLRTVALARQSKVYFSRTIKIIWYRAPNNLNANLQTEMT